MRQSQFISLLFLAGAGIIWQCNLPWTNAQDAESPKSSPEKSAPPSVTPKPMASRPAEVTAAKAEFDVVYTQWKQLLGQLRDLRTEFSASPNATEEQRKELIERYMKLTNVGEQLLPKLVAAGEKAYQAQGGKDADLKQFLVEVARDEAGRDNYEIAARVAKLLVDHGEQQQKLIEVAGMGAFHVSDFDVAEKYLQRAAKAGPLSQEAKQLLPQLAYEKKAWEREKKLREAEAKANDLPHVKIETRYGDIVVELFENEAPNTVANFISLVEKGFYNGLTFHRVLSGFMAQGGCPKGDGTGGPGYSIRGEASDEKIYRKHFRGSLSMALGDSPDSGGSQFFITFIPTNGLDGKHTVFGRVIEGMNVLSRIRRRNPDDPDAVLNPGDTIIKATVLRKRDHKYEPEQVK